MTFDIGNEIDRVGTLIREVGASEVLTRFRSLQHGDVDEKSPGDLVTIADRECERVLTTELRSVRDVTVVGEEAAAADASLLDAIDEAPATWIVDPVDGTNNFVAGSDDFAVMVAFTEGGETTASWIWLPTSDRLVTAQRGAGTRSNGTPVSTPAQTNDAGILKLRYVPEPQRRAFEAVAVNYQLSPDRRCAGVEYLDLIDAHTSFLGYWRTQPWDHAPGTLIACEAGLSTARFDGGTYRPGVDANGLLTGQADMCRQLTRELDAAAKASYGTT